MPKTTVRGALLSLALVLGTASVAQAATLSREPYLQSTDQTSTLIAFRTDASCPSVVRYGPSGTEAASEQPAGTQHLHELTGLSPGADYQYQVEACGEVLASGKRFRTAPEVGTQSVHFAAVGDQGRGNTAQKEVGQAILAARPQLTVSLGDNAYDSGTEAEHQTNLFQPLAELLAEVPYFPSPGNHEYVTNKAQPYVDNFHLPTNNTEQSERYYSFDYGHVHFVSLDSMCGRGTESDCTEAAQDEWLKQDLASSQQPWKVVYFHHPPFSSGDHLSEEKLRAKWGPIFEQNGVDLVLTGHDHDYERTYPMVGSEIAGKGQRGVTYLVVGSGGATLRPWPIDQPAWSAYRNNTDYGFLDVRVEGGTLTANMVTPSGAVIDSFSLQKDVPQTPATPPTRPDDPTTPEREDAPLGGEPTQPGNGLGCGAGGGLALAPFALAGALALLRRRNKARA